MEYYPRVELAWPCSHWQTVERSKSHGAFDTTSICETTHGRTASKMSDYLIFLRNIRCNLLQPLGYILAGKAVKTVAANALGIELFRNRIMVG